MTPPVEDRLLDVAEAAKILCTSPDYLYRHWEKYPFAEKLSPKQLRFSYVGIMKYLARLHGEENKHAGESVEASKTYWIRFGYKGLEYRHSAKTENKRDAERLLVHYLNQCARGEFQGFEVPGDIYLYAQ